MTIARRVYRLAHVVLLVCLSISQVLSAQDTVVPSEKEALLAKRDELGKVATQLVEKGDLVEAAKRFEEVLELEKSIFGKTDDEVLGTLNILSQVYQHASDFENERQALERILAIREQTVGPKAWQTRDAKRAIQDQVLRSKMSPKDIADLGVADRLNDQVVELFHGGRSAEAVKTALRARDIRKKILGEDHPDYATSLNNLARLHESMGDYAKAEPLLIQARDICQKILGEDHPNYATSLNNLASLYQSTGDYAKAEPLFLQALDICKKVLGKDHLDYATSLNNLAGLYDSMGDYAKAEPLFLQARDISKKVLGEDHPDYLTSLNNLAGVYDSMGDYAKAEPLYLQARDIRKKVLGEDHPDYVVSLNNLASLYQSTGDYAKAEPLSLQVRDIHKEILGEDHPDYATSLNNLATIYLSLGDYAKAEPLYLQARDIRKRVFGEDHPNYATSLNILAALYLSLGDYAKAEPLYLEARDIRKRVLGEDHPSYATTLNNLALLYKSKGDYAKAEPLLLKAQDIRRRVLGVGHPEYATTLNNLAALYLSLGDYAKAEPLAQQGINAQISVARKLLPAISEARALGWIATQSPHLGLYLTTAASRNSAPTISAASTVWDSRSLSARLLLAQRPGTSASPEARKLFAELRLARKKLSQLALAIPAPQQAELHQAAIARANEDKESLEQQLASINQAAARALIVRDAKIEDLLRLLPENAAVAMLVDTFVWNRVQHEGNPETSSKSFYELQPERIYELFVLRHDADGREKLAWEHLGPGEPIDAAIMAWRKQITEDRGSRMDDFFGQRLRQLVWSKIEPHVLDCKTVMLIPEGRLTALPWAALPGRKPGTVLLEDYALAVASYPQQLVDWLQREPSQASGLTLVGGVQHNLRPARDEPSTDPMPKPNSIQLASAERSAALIEEGRFWEDLKGTLHEAESIGKLFKERNQGTLDYLSGPKANEEAVAEAMQRSRYIHLATHGFFAKEKETEVFQRDLRRQQLFATELSGTHRSGSLAGRNPLLLTGVTLTGANLGPVKDEYGVPSGEDGILTAEEVESLDLEQAELVVLSACETGLGEGGYQGEGIFGLQRAFHQAGARTVVASLWKVEDQATQTLMVEFYRNLWEKKLPKLEALRQAQLDMLRHYRPAKGQIERGRVKRVQTKSASPADKDSKSASINATLAPYYWAPFVLSGDWR